jgi:rhamnosyltransferase
VPDFVRRFGMSIIISMNVSLVIRTYNEAEGLGPLLEMTKKQTIQPIDIVLVDSGSTDETVEIAREYGCHVIEIPKESFTFGYSLNVGLAAAKSDIAIGISAHCLPENRCWIEELVKPFEDGQVAGVYGQQIPFEDAGIIERKGLKEAYPDGVHARDVGSELFSNAHNAVRMSVWREMDFDEKLTGAEDIEWAIRAREKGYLIVYAPQSRVFHSHRETLRGVTKRFYREALALGLFQTGYAQAYGVMGAVLRWAKSVVLDYVFLFTFFVSVRYFIKWIILIPVFRAGVYYGQLRGINDASREE